MARLTGGRLASSRTACSGSKLILRTAVPLFPQANRTVELDLQFDLGKNGGLFLFGESGLSTSKGEQRGEEEEGMFFHDASFEWLLISEKP